MAEGKAKDKASENGADGAGQHNDFVHQLLEQAGELQEEKEALFSRIGANRDTLRMVRKTGLLSAEQSTAIDEFYPLRQKKADEDAPADPAAAAAA